MTSMSSVSLVGAIGCVGVNKSVVARKVDMRGQRDWVGCSMVFSLLRCFEAFVNPGREFLALVFEDGSS